MFKVILYLFYFLGLLSTSFASLADASSPKTIEDIPSVFIQSAFEAHEDKSIYAPYNAEFVTNQLRYALLGHDFRKANDYLQILKSSYPEKENFIKLFEASYSWAREQREKSAEELFELSKTFPSQVFPPTKLRDGFRFWFIRLAKEKRSHDAKKPLPQPQMNDTLYYSK